MRNLFLVGLVAVSFGCDDGGRNAADMSVPDLKPGPPDMAKVFDLSNLDFKGVGCGNMSCMPNETCCVRPVGAAFQTMCMAGTSCGSGAAAALCDGPEDCMNGEGCCAQVVFDVPDGGGTGPMPQSGMASCGAMCPAEVLGGGLNRTDFKSKLCHSPSDCAEYFGEIFGGMVKFDGCCSRPEVKFKFCAPDDQSYKTAGGYTCL